MEFQEDTFSSACLGFGIVSLFVSPLLGIALICAAAVLFAWKK